MYMVYKAGVGLQGVSVMVGITGISGMVNMHLSYCTTIAHK